MISFKNSGHWGLLILAIGILLPLSLIACSTGWKKNASLAQNLLQSSIILRQGTPRAPIFQIVEKGGENPDAQVFQFEETRIYLEFSRSATITEIQNAVKARFPENKLLTSDPDSGRLRFEGWSGKDPVTFPFGYALLIGILLAFTGAALMIFSRSANHRTS